MSASLSLVGLLFLGAEFSCDFLTKHFSFLKSFLGRGVFNLLYSAH